MKLHRLALVGAVAVAALVMGTRDGQATTQPAFVSIQAGPTSFLAAPASSGLFASSADMGLEVILTEYQSLFSSDDGDSCSTSAADKWCSTSPSYKYCTAIEAGWCSANGVGHNCSTSTGGNSECSAGIDKGATCSAKGNGVCSSFSANSHCSVQEDNEGSCTTTPQGSCSVHGGGTCSVKGQPSSTGPCNG
ncbi:MAG: hypothetical protein AAF682_23025 [Planctomycetota bacterium]